MFLVKKMKTWITTDTHFFDEDMLLLGRPKNHTHAIVKRWNGCVSDDDLVIHLGDLTSDSLRTKEEILPLLKGRKQLVLGNHDHKSMKWYYDAGFMGVFHAYKYYNVYFTHIPVLELPAGATINIHGHFHNNPKEKWEHMTGEHNYLLSLEEENLFPVQLENFLERHGKLEEFWSYKRNMS